MPVIGITGGVASGKSSFTEQLSRRITAEVFDADAVARRLADSDPETRSKIASQFGSEVIEIDGKLNRARLREIVFGDPGKRKTLEAILHPLVRSEWICTATAARSNKSWLLLDIPLLFEVGAEAECDMVVVVACLPATQRARIISQRGLAGEMADQMIASQTSLASKAARADYVIWNDAPTARLEEQAEIFAGYLGKRYG